MGRDFVGITVAVLVGLIPPVWFALDSDPAPPNGETFVTVPDIIDAPDPFVESAEIQVFLVHWGTEERYRGTGAPGINLQVETAGDVIGWTLQAWANQTTPSPLPRICSQDEVHFSSYDWFFEADGGPESGHGTFITKPTTVPERLLPAGDQCLLRIGSTGVWQVRVCIEGKPGGPLGLYDAEDGRHLDSWDRCIDQQFQVSP
jgi:hypothetical protein